MVGSGHKREDQGTTLYRETELTPATEPAAPEPQTPPVPPDVPAIERLFQAVVERRIALEETLGQLVAALPEEGPWSMLRAQAQTEQRMAGKVGEVDHWRAMIAEIQRPKGPMIRVVEGHDKSLKVVCVAEFSHRTKTRIVLRDGGRASRLRFGLEGYERDAHDTRWRIHPDDLALAQTTDWTPPKPHKSAKKNT